MNSRKVVGLFVKTLAIGGLVGLITSFFVNPGVYSENLNPLNIMELIGLILFYIGFGLLASVVSQTGFFAYLFIHRFGLGLFRGFWPSVQALVIIFVLFDLVYFPYKAYNGNVSVWWFVLMAATLLGYGWIIAKRKAKETNKSAFIPALFLMVVITTVEWVPGLQADGIDYALLMIFSLLACNTYQLLVLHRLTKSGETKQSRTNQKMNVKKA